MPWQLAAIAAEERRLICELEDEAVGIYDVCPEKFKKKRKMRVHRAGLLAIVGAFSLSGLYSGMRDQNAGYKARKPFCDWITQGPAVCTARPVGSGCVRTRREMGFSGMYPQFDAAVLRLILNCGVVGHGLAGAVAHSRQTFGSNAA